MIPFRAPTDDILFALQVARADALPGWDDDLARALIDHFASFAEAEIAPLDPVGDALGCRLENGQVHLPEGFPAAYRALIDQGWQKLALPEAIGGEGVPAPLAGAVSEIFSGACHALSMLTALVPGAVRVLMTHGTQAQQAAHLPDLVSGAALATMCLTEPGAGSDLAAIRTRARRTGDHWRIDGEKIFISGGGQNLSESILHLILARTGTMADGVKGLSLFLARSGGAVGANGISVARIEHKMGLHASPTCAMVFDGCEAELIGPEGEGLAAMFTLMNHARIDVALQGVAHAARATAIATAHALERVQGRTSDGRIARLADHPDVRRMLDEGRRLTLATRAMCALTLVEIEAASRPDLLEFLTPLVKIAATEAGMRAADLGIQVLGGYGYLTEYRIEQTWRDARITAIYEGANGIHAGALAGRLLRRNAGAAGAAFAAYVSEIAPETPELARRLHDWQALRATLLLQPDPAERAWEFAQASIALFEAAVWARMEALAEAAPDPAEIRRLAAQALGRTTPEALRRTA
ncbi:acyl-CoA dehydrogenase family protein [Rhodobacter capsulatus]|uniref:acyl-CoA dehydrogenase family protein n=1 Tax=Rhodobacter capsulatus TaxID=1061 RepID=UPI0040259EB8